MNAATLVAGLAAGLVLLLLYIRWKLRYLKVKCSQSGSSEPDCPPCTPEMPVQVVHRLCPHHNVVQSYEVEQKDSLDEHLDVLTRKLAEKEGRLRLSKSKIRETQNEIDNLHAIDQTVRLKYREIMDSLKTDLISNEKECKKLQEQIEWVSRRRAELKEEVRQGQRMYGEAAAELATNLAEMQRGRNDYNVTEKPYELSAMSLRHRKEPQLPRASLDGSDLIKADLSEKSSLTSRPTLLGHQPDLDQNV